MKYSEFPIGYKIIIPVAICSILLILSILIYNMFDKTPPSSCEYIVSFTFISILLYRFVILFKKS